MITVLNTKMGNRRTESRVAGDGQRGERLRGRHDLDGVDVHARRQGRHPGDRFRNVVRPQRMRAGIDGVRFVPIPPIAGQGKFSVPAQTWLHVGHPHARARQIRAQIAAELGHERLGAAIDVSARIRIFTSHRTDIHNQPALAGHHARQKSVRHQRQAGDIGIDHGPPILQEGLLGFFSPERQAGVVHEDIDVAPSFGQGGLHVGDGLLVANIQRHRQHGIAIPLLQIEQPFHPAGGGNHPIAVAQEAFADCAAKACGSPGHEGDLCWCGIVHKSSGCAVCAPIAEPAHWCDVMPLRIPHLRDA